MTGLVLVGAGGLAREVIAVERALGARDRVVVVDDDPDRWGSEVGGCPVVGGLAEVERLDDLEVLLCVGAGPARRSLAARLTDLGVEEERWAVLTAPGVRVPEGCAVGAGSILLDRVVLTADVHVGRHVVVMPGVVLTHDCRVEDHATLCSGVALGGGVRVGAAAYVGMNASVRQGVAVGAGATLGMGAALLEDLPAGQTWAGVPATPIRGA